MVTATDARMRVELVTESHLPALVEFYRQVWDEKSELASVREARRAAAAANPVSPGEAPPVFLFLIGDEAVGHLGTIPVMLWTEGVTQPAHWLQGLWVLPEHRNGPIGFLLVREAMRHLGVALSVVVEDAPRRLFEAHGFEDLGLVPNYLRLLRPGRVLSQLDTERIGIVRIPGWAHSGLRVAQKTGLAALTGAGVAGATRLWVSMAGRGAARSSEECLSLDAREIDALWARVRAGLEAAPARDAAYLRHRYPLGEGSPYRALTVRDGNSLVALALLRRPGSSQDARLGGTRVTVLTELLFPIDRPDLGLAVLAGAEEMAREDGADALLCTASHSALRPLLNKRAFVPLPGNQHFMVRNPGNGGTITSSISRWWLTRGDSRADSPF